MKSAAVSVDRSSTSPSWTGVQRAAGPTRGSHRPTELGGGGSIRLASSRPGSSLTTSVRIARMRRIHRQVVVDGVDRPERDREIDLVASAPSRPHRAGSRSSWMPRPERNVTR